MPARPLAACVALPATPRFLSFPWFAHFKVTPRWGLAVALVNLVGILYGFYYYLPQFEKTPPALWLFAPDSPLAVLWAELALGLYWLRRWRTGRREEAPGLGGATLDALAFVGNVQVGLWTVYVLVAYAGAFDTFTLNLNTVLLAGHAGMVLLGLLFVDGMRARARVRRGVQMAGIALAAAFYLVQDALDYFGPDYMGRGCGMRPHTVPCEPGLEAILAGVTFALTVASTLLLAWLVRPRRESLPKTAPRGRA